jgi:phosphoesterase RecJ-like protein
MTARANGPIGDTRDVPDHRIEPLRAIAQALASAQRVLLTTHVNADGDGAGSETAIAAWLRSLGKTVWITNPTAFPDMYRHLLHDPATVADPGTARAVEAMRTSDLAVVLDTGEPSRVGKVADALDKRPVVVLDHHLASDATIQGIVLQDASACATGELVYDLLTVENVPRPWSPAIVEGIYTAIVTDTGSFRYSNTSPRSHAIAADLIAQGVDPEAVYRRIFATVPLKRVQLLRHALDHLEVDAELPITWISIERGIMESLGTTSDDLEGIVEQARSIEGTEVAILFRATSDNATKISLRSSGAVNVNAIARLFGGGGHMKASGALVGRPLQVVRPEVLEATRAALRAEGLGFRSSRDSS